MCFMIIVTGKSKLFEFVYALGTSCSRPGLLYCRQQERNQYSKQPACFVLPALPVLITAVAIWQLIEKGELQFNDRIFEVLNHEDDITHAGKAFDERLSLITLEQLLQHRGGWDPNKSVDPMVQSVGFAKLAIVDASADQAAIIKAMLSQQFDFNPGERYAYSNFGYCLLGRVIEKLSGQTYEDYVKEHVFATIGVSTMQLGATRLENGGRLRCDTISLGQRDPSFSRISAK